MKSSLDCYLPSKLLEVSKLEVSKLRTSVLLRNSTNVIKLFALRVLISIALVPTVACYSLPGSAERQSTPSEGSLLAAEAKSKDIRLPPDARVVNVEKFGARGDGKTDDTQAIRKAIIWALENAPSRYSAPPFVYFPKGVYRVSDELQSRIPEQIGKWSDGWRAGMLLLGENRSETVIKLADSASGYGNPTQPKAVIKTGSETDKTDSPNGGGNRAFRHSVINLTVDTGRNNPGAIGIDYLAHNQGTVKEVTIRSGDRRGHAGLSLARPWPGPAFVKNVTIEGFDYGIEVARFEYGITFENLLLKHQNKAGIFNHRNTLAIRKLLSINSVPAFVIEGTHAQVTLVDSELRGGSEVNPAITSEGKLLLQDVSVAGYGQAIVDHTGASLLSMSGAEKLIDRYATDIISLFDSRPRSLDLPVKKSPTFHTNNFRQWANVEDFGATPNNNADDDASAIQAAIDSGAEVVYLPNGMFYVESPVILRGAVKKLMGMQSSLRPKPNFPNDRPLLRFDGGTSDFTIVEHLYMNVNATPKVSAAVAIEHNSDKTLVVRHSTVGRGAYRNTVNGIGDVFWEDNIGRRILILHPQNFWARQLNAEFGNKPLVENIGGTLWVLGMKTEGEMPIIKTVRGKTELLGFHFRTLHKVNPSTPMFINDEGHVSLNWSGGPYQYKIKVMERRQGRWRKLERSSLAEKASRPFGLVPLYIGIPSEEDYTK